MGSVGPGNCNAQNSEVGADGHCYPFCSANYSAVDNGPVCAKNCPPGFISAGSTGTSSLACLKPSFAREIKPNLGCPVGADRQYDKCLLDCPVGTTKKYNLCMPNCPLNFVDTPDGLSCQAEFIKRISTVREACYANETRVSGRICLSPCPSGTVPYGANAELCYSTVPASLWPYFWTGDSSFSNWASQGPLVSKILFSRTQTSAFCAPGFEPLNGQCYSDCPQGSSPLGAQCVANCPQTFLDTANQSACLRPSYTRSPEKNVFQSAETVLKYIAGVILLLIGFSAFVRLKK